ncbi:MAG: DUF3006 family protein [Ruminococcaceae bacterium]|nr:DUF3006 family protein [Oscillospiraceae bacterium]
MKILYVDKVEGAYVICRSSDEEEIHRFALPIEDAPAGVKKDDCIVIDDEGNAVIDQERTKAYKLSPKKRRRR